MHFEGPNVIRSKYSIKYIIGENLPGVSLNCVNLSIVTNRSIVSRLKYPFCGVFLNSLIRSLTFGFIRTLMLYLALVSSFLCPVCERRGAPALIYLSRENRDLLN